MKEVMERQNKTNFDKNNVWAIGINAIAIFLTFAATALIYPLYAPYRPFFFNSQSTNQPPSLPTSTILALRPYDTYALLLLRLLLSTNILIATLPLLRNKDACEDIPLTPAQRQLLGLPPMSRPATPQEKEQWITPPRYTRSRSGTPQSPGSSLRAQASGSPGSGSMFGNSMQRQGSGSPFGGNGSPGQWSPSSLTPLRGGVGDERRRLSYNARQSPLSASDFDSTMGTTTGMESASIGTPTRKGNRASVGLNSKWLYEKGKGSPRRGSGGGAGWDPKGWGTGSVFN